MRRKNVVLLFVFFVTCSVADVALAIQVLALDTARRIYWSEENRQQVTGTLVRELGRQALLIAARDELGFRTLDATLREDVRDADDALSLLLTVDARITDTCRVQVIQPTGRNRNTIFDHTFDFHANSRKTFLTLAPQFEEASRRQFVDLLKNIGAEPQAIKESVREPDATYAAELVVIDELLREPDMLSQFIAVRRTHSLIAEWGESGAALVRLVRSYSHLGLLTESHWSMATNALKARSLIYAQRLLAKYPDDALSKWAEAYAQAFAGIHFEALQALEKLERAEHGSMPEWTGLIAPFCNYDVQGLTALAASKFLDGWASYLAIWAAYTTGEERIFVDVTLEKAPKCAEAINLYYLLADSSPIGIMRMTQYGGTRVLLERIPARLQAMEEIPAEIRDAMTVPADGEQPFLVWSRVLDGFQAAEPAGEPNWAVLGNLLEDSLVALAELSVRVEKGAYQEHPLDETVSTFLPIVEKHPTGPYFKTILPRQNRDQETLRQVVRDLSFEDPNKWMYRVFSDLWNLRNGRDERIGHTAYSVASRDFTCPSLVIASRVAQNDLEYRKMLMSELGKISPRSPLALVYEIRYDHEGATVVDDKRLATWETRAADHPGPWRELGSLYRQREDFANAIRCYEKSIQLLPEYDTLHALASVYEEQEEFEKVVPTLKRYLEVEEYGLGHSHTNAAIAEFLMRREEFDEAKPYALEAAQSYSAYALQVAARACEWAQDIQEADRWYAELSRAYPSHRGLEWWLFRRRAGLPKRKEARELAAKTMGSEERFNRDSDYWWPLAYYLLDGDDERALELAQLRSQQNSSVNSESHLLTLALRLGERAIHQASLARLLQPSEANKGNKQSWSARYARTIERLLHEESEKEVPFDEMDALLQDDDAVIGWCDASYFFGKLLLIKGRDEIGLRYLQHGADFRDQGRITWHLAVAELTERRQEAR